MRDLSLHLLDLAQNSITAGASLVTIRLFLDNGSWFGIRPSGTEPKIKFYFYSCQDSRDEALRVNRQIRDEVLEMIRSVE